MKNDFAFVLLAGGKSERMGIPKGLLLYKNSYWILEQLNRIATTDISEIYIGLGHNYQLYFDAIPWLKEAQNQFIKYKEMKVKVVINKNPALGSFSTLQIILKTIPKNQSILINPIDIPILNTEELKSVIATKNKIVLPNFNNKNGHPIKLSPIFWNSLLFLNPFDENSRLDLEIKKTNCSDQTIIEVKDSAVIKNLNTKNDWDEFLKFNSL
jgi:CTP:molybdopterin cytidylyltransferase MocA